MHIHTHETIKYLMMQTVHMFSTDRVSQSLPACQVSTAAGRKVYTTWLL